MGRDHKEAPNAAEYWPVTIAKLPAQASSEFGPVFLVGQILYRDCNRAQNIASMFTLNLALRSMMLTVAFADFST